MVSGHGQQDVLEIRLQARAAEVEHRPVGGVDDLDAQAVAGDLEVDLVLEVLEHRIFVDLVLQLLQQQRQTLSLNLLGEVLGLIGVDLVVLLGADPAFVGVRLGLDLRIEGLVRRRRRRAAEVDDVGAGAFAETDGVLEVSGNRLLLLRGGRRQQPEHQEERHHRRGEVGEGDLPRAAVVAGGIALDALDDDRLVIVHLSTVPPLSGRARPARARRRSADGRAAAPCGRTRRPAKAACRKRKRPGRP